MILSVGHRHAAQEWSLLEGKIVTMRWFWNCCIHLVFLCCGENDGGKLFCSSCLCEQKLNARSGKRISRAALWLNQQSVHSAVLWNSFPVLRRRSWRMFLWRLAVITFLQISHCNFCSCWFVCWVFCFYLSFQLKIVEWVLGFTVLLLYILDELFCESSKKKKIKKYGIIWNY